MTTKYGMFREHDYLTPGQAIANGKDDPAATKSDGLNLKATAPHTGKNNDATFDKFVSLHESDRYVDPARRELLINREKKKHNVTELPFKATSPMKKSTGVGDYYGVFEPKVPAGQPLNGFAKVAKGDVAVVPRGLYTSPAKKGTYGMNKTTISERAVGVKGVATEYEYQHDPDAMHKQKIIDDHAKDVKARVSEIPFKPANPPKKGGAGVPNTTISKGKGIANEYEYVLGADPNYSAAAKDSPEALAAATAAAMPAGTPFKPASSHLAGNKWPEYIHDPEVPKMKAEAEKKKKEAARLAAAGAWRPNQGPKTDMCRSIVRMNI